MRLGRANLRMARQVGESAVGSGGEQGRTWKLGTLVRLSYRGLCMALACCAVIFTTSLRCSGQDIDTLITSQTPRRSSVLDEAQSPAERRAILALYKEKDAPTRARLAEAFIKNFPKSGFLAEAYQIAAKWEIQVGDYGDALHDAALSLRLYPENELLLVSIADVQAQQGLYSQAETNALSASDDLQRFVRPASVSSQQWKSLEPQLEATCSFILGRARMALAIGSNSAEAKRSGLKVALSDLARAAALNPRDDEVQYLAGLAEVASGNTQSAAEHFARAYRLKGPLASKAAGQLRTLYSVSFRASRPIFESYLQSIPDPPVATEQGASAQVADHDGQLPGYAGSEACKQCHAEICQSWAHTGMSKMFRPYDPANVIGDFTHHLTYDVGESIEWSNGRLTVIPPKIKVPFARMIAEHGRNFFMIRDTHGGWHKYRVDYTIGSKWEQGYATRLPNGEVHVMPIQYNRNQKKWVDFWQIADPPGSPRADVTEWLKMSPLTSYQANCAVCHTSQLRNVKGGGFEPQGLEFREPGIDCEMCHGPSQRHVVAMLKAQPYVKRPVDPPVDFTKITAQQFMAICSQCHMQSAVRSPGPDGELNYSREGVFFMHYKSRPYDEFSRKGFYKDGRFRQTSFIVESVLRTKCYKKGEVTCGSCHDPHPTDAESNPVSLKFRNHPDEMCLQCHSEYREKAALVRHTHHAYYSVGSRCASCHMPRIVDALLFEARSHEFDQIPSAAMTLRFGQNDSPNACLLCHQDKEAIWVKQQQTAWRSSPAD